MNHEKSDLIIFSVADITCAFQCNVVKEVIRNSKNIIPVKRSAQAVRGVINLRGEIVTVLDLRIIFDQKIIDSKDMIIVVESGEENIGLMVNEVMDVIQY